MWQNYWLDYQKIFEFILTRVQYATSDHTYDVTPIGFSEL